MIADKGLGAVVRVQVVIVEDRSLPTFGGFPVSNLE
jgi:hypothetical protein